MAEGRSTGPPAYLRAVSGGVELALKVVPGASRDRLIGPLGNALKVQVAAPPERGRANEAVERLLAEALGVAPRQVRVTRGASSPVKTVFAEGVTLEQAAMRLTQPRT